MALALNEIFASDHFQSKLQHLNQWNCLSFLYQGLYLEENFKDLIAKHFKTLNSLNEYQTFKTWTSYLKA